MGYATSTTPNYGSSADLPGTDKDLKGGKKGSEDLQGDDKAKQLQNKGEAITRKIERQARKIPSATFLALAGGSIAVSLGLAVALRKKAWANFVGLWAPTLLLFGVYEKLLQMEDNRGVGGFAGDAT